MSGVGEGWRRMRREKEEGEASGGVGGGLADAEATPSRTVNKTSEICVPDMNVHETSANPMLNRCKGSANPDPLLTRC